MNIYPKEAALRRRETASGHFTMREVWSTIENRDQVENSLPPVFSFHSPNSQLFFI